MSHRFGELDYTRLGAAPMSTGHDPEYGDFDVLAIRREWFIDQRNFTVAGRTLSYRGGGGNTSALGDTPHLRRAGHVPGLGRPPA